MKPLKRNNLIIHEIDDEILLYDPDQDRTHRLNASAALVWRACDGARTVEDIAGLLTERYEVEFAAACRDAQSTIDQMIEQRIVAAG